MAPRPLSLSATDACDASTEDTAGDTADGQDHRKSKESITPDSHTSHAASEDRNTNTTTQSTANLSCTHGGNCFLIIEEDSVSEESLPKPEDNPHPRQTSSPIEDIPTMSSTELPTEAEQHQPEDVEDLSPSLSDDVPAESSTVAPAEVKHQQAENKEVLLQALAKASLVSL